MERRRMKKERIEREKKKKPSNICIKAFGYQCRQNSNDDIAIQD